MHTLDTHQNQVGVDGCNTLDTHLNQMHTLDTHQNQVGVDGCPVSS